MAVTGFWPVFKNLKATLDYADNPDKTTAPEYLDEDLYAALCYARNDDTVCPLRPAPESLKVNSIRSGIPLTLCAFRSRQSIGSVPCG